MKKTLKSILALTLALIMLLGTLTVFAAEGDTVEWDFVWWTDEYVWAGEAKTGANTITYNDEANQVYLDFNAEKAGYYTVRYNSTIIDWAGFPYKYDENKASDESFIDYYVDENDIQTTLVKLDAGSTILGVDYYNSEVSSSDITIEYLGEAVTDITVDEKFLVGMLDEYDIFCDFSEGYMFTDYVVTFSEGKTYGFEHSYLEFKCENYAEGENTVTAVFEEFEKDIKVNVFSVESTVKSAELSNYENYTSIVYNYEGESNAYYIFDESVKVTFSDGTTYTAPISYSQGTVIFPNGREYPVSVYYSSSDDGPTLAIAVAEKEVTVYECTESQAGVLDNIGALEDENYYDFYDYIEEIYYGMENAVEIEDGDEFIKAATELFFDSLSSFSYMLSDIFSNFMQFFKYYFTNV